MPPKAAANAKGGKPKKRDDDDEALLAQHAAQAAEASKELAKVKAAEEAKRIKAEKETLAKEQAAREAAAKRAPIVINDVAKSIADFVRSRRPGMRDTCWVTYILHRVMMQAVEGHRRLQLNVAEAPEAPTTAEMVTGFEVHNDTFPGDNHAWNVITTNSGNKYVIDMSLEQFLPSGRWGYKRDSRPEEGWVPVKATSRLVAAEDATNKTHVGILATDAGILSDGAIDVTIGVPRGCHDKYVRFLNAANDGRHKNMSAEERSIGEILQRNKTVPQWLELHHKLEAEFLA